MDDEFRKQLEDYFTSAELVELLDIRVGDLIGFFEDYIMENATEVKEYMNYGE